MEIQQMRHLLAAANSTSYAQAARKCFTSRQNIAHSVKAIEGELGITLFERQGNVMSLTENGTRAVRVIDEVITNVDKLRVMFSEREPDGASLSLAVSVNLFAGMPDGLERVFEKCSNHVQFLELDSEQCYDLVCAGKADAAIVMCMDRTFPQCNAIRIGGSLAYALVSDESPLAGKSGCVPSDFIGYNLILMSEPSFQYEPLFSHLDRNGFDRSAVNVIPSTSSMIHLIRARGQKCVAIPSRKFAANPPRGTVAVPIVDQRMNWGFYILYRDEGKKRDDLMRLMKDIQEAYKKTNYSS